MKRYFLLVLLFSVVTPLLLTTPALGQNASGGGQPRFSVAVTDAHGAPIRDLRSDEFVIELAGKQQSGQVQAPASLPDGTARRPGDGRGLVVVVIDTMHTQWREEKYLRLDAGKYLAACAKRDVPVSLLVLNREGTLFPVHEYPAGSVTLAAALDRADAEMHHKTAASDASPEVTAEAARLVDFYRGTGKFATAESIRAYPGLILDGFKTVARYVAGIPGRKSLIWINSGMPFAVEQKQRRIGSPTNEKDLDYPYLLTPDQVNELQVKWKEAIGAMQNSELALFPVQTRSSAFVRTDPEILHSMVSLAQMTGGVEEHSPGYVFAQLQELQETNAAAYEAVLTPEALRGCMSDWCEMRISVKRAGAQVLAPQGFFRDTRFGEPGLAAVAQAPAETGPAPNAIPFTVDWKPAETAGAKKRIAFVVKFSSQAGIPSEGSADLNLEISVHPFCNGTEKNGVAFTAKTQLPAATLDQIRVKGFVLNNVLELEPGDYDVRFVVHDKATGRSGMLNVPLKVA